MTLHGPGQPASAIYRSHPPITHGSQAQREPRHATDEMTTRSNIVSTSLCVCQHFSTKRITTETTSAGRPAVIVWRGSRYPLRVLSSWEGRLYRIATTLNGDPAIAEIAKDDRGWWLRQWWTF